MPLSIRPATIDDFPQILALNQAYVHYTSALDRDRLLTLHHQSYLHLIAEQNQQCVGFLLSFTHLAAYDSENFSWFTQRGDNFVYVDRIVIAQSAQGCGIGKALYQRLFANAREHGVQSVCCEYNAIPLNTVSAGFHRAFGFQEIGRRTFPNTAKAYSMQRLFL